MRRQKDYWEQHIMNWEKSAYNQSWSGSLIEKLATLFRGHIVHRKNTCKKMLIQEVKDRKLLELGCGTGGLLLELTREGLPLSAVGWEISQEAARIGKETVASSNLEDVCSITCRDIEHSLEEVRFFDLVYGLGILEYLEQETLHLLFEQLKDCAFFFQYHRKCLSGKNLLHVVYRSLKRIPIYNQYSKSEIKKIYMKAGLPETDIQFLDEKGNSFVYRLPRTVTSTRFE